MLTINYFIWFTQDCLREVKFVMPASKTNVECAANKKGIFVSSTGTEQGKTILASGIAAWWKSVTGAAPAVWKPVQSGVQWGASNADSYRLKWGGGLEDKQEQDIVSLAFSAPLSPLAAAARENVSINCAALRREGITRLSQGLPLVVEGAGGVAVPFANTYTMCSLASDLELPMLIVAQPLLGTISHTVTAVHYAREQGIPDIAVVMGGLAPEQLEREHECEENAQIIAEQAQVPVLGRLPWIPQPVMHDPHAWSSWRAQWVEAMSRVSLLCDWLKGRMNEVNKERCADSSSLTSDC